VAPPEEEVFLWTGAHDLSYFLSLLARVLAPSELLIITTLGLNALQVIRPSKIHHAVFAMDEAAVDGMSERLGSERLVFAPYTADVIEAAKAGNRYGVLSYQWIRRTRAFHVLMEAYPAFSK